MFCNDALFGPSSMPYSFKAILNFLYIIYLSRCTDFVITRSVGKLEQNNCCSKANYDRKWIEFIYEANVISVGNLYCYDMLGLIKKKVRILITAEILYVSSLWHKIQFTILSESSLLAKTNLRKDESETCVGKMWSNGRNNRGETMIDFLLQSLNWVRDGTSQEVHIEPEMRSTLSWQNKNKWLK